MNAAGDRTDLPLNWKPCLAENAISEYAKVAAIKSIALQLADSLLFAPRSLLRIAKIGAQFEVTNSP
ncbi:MAG: hypothetical protein OXG77_00180 [Chloroflexi bacterium]|nr:hypothetical protein [Chloroflexota bacterium]